MQIEEYIPLAPYTTFHIGGPAHFFVRVATIDELKKALDFARAQNQRALILGGGSNVLVDDRGFDGLVIKLELRGVEEKDGLLIAAAGESWDKLVESAVKENLWGIENLSGIPGTVGAAPIQNIGAYGTEVADTLAWVDAFDVKENRLMKLASAQCGFGYRTSIFKKESGRYCVMRVALQLRTGGTPNLAYRDLAEAFEDNPSPALADVRRAVLAIRARKFPDLAKEGTAGSFFLNPVVSVEQAAQLKRKFPEMPQFAAPGGVKISLAWVLDHILGARGTRYGGARLFEKQPLVIAAQHGTSSRDVRALAQEIKKRVYEELQIEIEPEVKILS